MVLNSMERLFPQSRIMQQFDYLIVGQGLAGSLLGWELIRRGCRIMLVDIGRSNASQVAAGLINPVTGMRLVKSNNIEQLLPAAMDCYQALARQFKQTYFIPKPMWHIIDSDQTLEYYNTRLLDDSYKKYLKSIHWPPSDTLVKAPLGYISQQQTGYLLTRPLLKTLKIFFQDQNCYQQTNLNYRDIHISASQLSWNNIQARKLIFCEGYQCHNNPWFSWLPMRPVKGEILTLKTQCPLPDKILNYGNWAIPVNETTLRTGATFDRENINVTPTQTGRMNLLASLKSIVPEMGSAQVQEHSADIRPCTVDKSPLIGSHTQHPQLTVFNGFGAKGSLLIPWYAQRFADNLLKQTDLPKNVDIKRYSQT